MHDKILRLPRVKDCTGLSRTGIYDRIAKGEFPAQIPIGARAVGWLESEVEAWIAQRVAISREHNSAQKGASWDETTLTHAGRARSRADKVA